MNKRLSKLVIFILITIATMTYTAVVSFAINTYFRTDFQPDVGVGTDGQPVDLYRWTYILDPGGKGYVLNHHYSTPIYAGYTGGFTEKGEIIGKVPAYINGKPVISMIGTFAGVKDLKVAPILPDTVANLSFTFTHSGLTSLPDNFTMPKSAFYMENMFYSCGSLALPKNFSIPEISGYDIPEVFGPKDDYGDGAQYVTYVNESMHSYALAHPDETNWINKFDKGIGTDGQPVDLTLWRYYLLNDGSGYAINAYYYPFVPAYLGGFTEKGEIIGKVPAYINGKPVVKMMGTFADLKDLKVAPILPDKVTDVSYLFYRCSNLTMLPESFTLPSGVINVTSLFKDCTKLSILPENFQLPKSAFNNCENMFYGCDLLFLPKKFHIPEDTKSKNIFGPKIKTQTNNPQTVKIYNGSCGIDEYVNKHQDQTNWVTEDLGIGEDGKLIDLSLWKYYTNDEVKGFILNNSDNPTSNGYIGGFTLEGKIIGNVPAFINGKPVVSVNSTFMGLSELKIPPHIPNTVTILKRAFSNCNNLSTLDEFMLPRYATDISSMFENCTSLDVLPFGFCNPNSVTKISKLFFGCSSLKSLPNSFAIPKGVTDISNLFNGCSSLTSIPSNFTIPSGVVNIQNLFSGCSSLGSLPNSFTIPKGVTDISNLFKGCSKLKSIPLNFNIPNDVSKMSYAFYGCDNLTLPISFKIPSHIEDEVFGPKISTYGTNAQTVTYSNNEMNNYALAHPNTTNWKYDNPIQYAAGQNYNFTVSANNVTNFKDIVYVLNYDNKYFDIVNLCNGVNPTKTTAGEVPGTDITILEITPTKIKFKCNKEVPASKSWSGVVNIITLKAKQNASSNVSVSTETK